MNSSLPHGSEGLSNPEEVKGGISRPSSTDDQSDVGERRRGWVSDSKIQGVSDGEWPFTTHGKGMDEPAEDPRSLRLFVLFPEPEEVSLGINAVGKVAHARHRHLARDEFSPEALHLLHRCIDGCHAEIVHHAL